MLQLYHRFGGGICFLAMQCRWFPHWASVVCGPKYCWHNFLGRFWFIRHTSDTWKYWKYHWTRFCQNAPFLDAAHDGCCIFPRKMAIFLTLHKVQKTQILILVLNKSTISAVFLIVRFSGEQKTALTCITGQDFVRTHLFLAAAHDGCCIFPREMAIFLTLHKVNYSIFTAASNRSTPDRFEIIL